jgi:hypothetical protein
MSANITNTINIKDYLANTSIKDKKVLKDNKLKKYIVNYVGKKYNPKDGNVTVEMIINLLSQEFPDLLLVMAEENYLRGYKQALNDVDLTTNKIVKERNDKGKQQPDNIK